MVVCNAIRLVSGVIFHLIRLIRIFRNRLNATYLIVLPSVRLRNYVRINVSRRFVVFLRVNLMSALSNGPTRSRTLIISRMNRSALTILRLRLIYRRFKGRGLIVTNFIVGLQCTSFRRILVSRNEIRVQSRALRRCTRRVIINLRSSFFRNGTLRVFRTQGLLRRLRRQIIRRRQVLILLLRNRRINRLSVTSRTGRLITSNILRSRRRTCQRSRSNRSSNGANYNGVGDETEGLAFITLVAVWSLYCGREGIRSGVRLVAGGWWLL